MGLNKLENIINLSDFRDKLAQQNLFIKKDYFHSLSFHQLISEATQTLGRLKEEHFNYHLILKARVLLTEFNARININNEVFSDHLKELQKKVEQKIHSLDKKIKDHNLPN